MEIRVISNTRYHISLSVLICIFAVQDVYCQSLQPMHIYIGYSCPLTWCDAELQCRKENGHLVNIASNDEHQILMSSSLSYSIKLNLGVDVNYWIGLRYLHDKHVWSDGTLLGDYQIWKTPYDDNKTCVSVSDDGLAWQTRTCDVPRQFVCEVIEDRCRFINIRDRRLKSNLGPQETFIVDFGYECFGQCLKRFNTSHMCWASSISEDKICVLHFTSDSLMYFVRGHDSWLLPDIGITTSIMICHLARLGDCDKLQLNESGSYNFSFDLGCSLTISSSFETSMLNVESATDSNTPSEYTNTPSEYLDLPTEYLNVPTEDLNLYTEYFSTTSEYLNTPLEHFSMIISQSMLSDSVQLDSSTLFSVSGSVILTSSPEEYLSSQSITSTCLCDCNLCKALVANSEILEVFRNLTLEEKMIQVRKDMQLNRKTLTSVMTLKTSAPDHRTSAQSIGCIGIAVLIFVFGGIFIMDFPALVGDFKELKKHCTRKDICS